jgi:hypothetical protein
MTGDHPRNTAPMLSSQRCGAKTRSGKPCRSPAVHGKRRCRMHGGATGSGAPRGNKNAQKHGLYTREAIAQRRQLRTDATIAQANSEDRLSDNSGSGPFTDPSLTEYGKPVNRSWTRRSGRGADKRF